MPNWCNNDLVVSVSDETMDSIKELKDFTDKALSNYNEEEQAYPLLGNLYPTPEFEGDGWYQWRLDNWGTKWDVRAIDEGGDEYNQAFTFDSAWSPPIEWLEYVSSKYPKLIFKLRYHEDGAGFMGVAVGEYGKVENKSLDY